MPLLTLVVWIAVVGLVVWLVTTYIPMPEPFRKVIIVVAVVVLILWLVNAVVPLTGGGPWIGRHP
jgi:hypothetical protein